MKSLLIVCGALAREVLTLRDKHGWDADVQAVPAGLHNRPARIPEAVVERAEACNHHQYDRVVVVYGDCGTGGRLQAVLDQHGWLGLSVPHCYSLFAGSDRFEQFMREEPGTFFLTDYLAGSFDHLVTEGLGLDRHPELREEYFRRYRRMVYLSQRVSPELIAKAHQASESLGLPLEVQHTGLAELDRELVQLLESKRAKTGKGSQKAGEPGKTKGSDRND